MIASNFRVPSRAMRIQSFRLPQNTIALSGRLSVVALLLGIGACSNFGRSPTFTGSTNQREIISAQPAVGSTYTGGGGYSGGVQAAELPPPSGVVSPPAYASASQPRPQAYTPPSASAPASPPPTQLASLEQGPRHLGAPPSTLGEQASRFQRSSAGSSGSSGGQTTHVVQSGDTAWNISRRYGVSVAQLAAANGGSTTVKLGTRLIIPGGGGGGSAPQPNVQLASLNPQVTPQTPAPAPAPAVPAAIAQPQQGASPIADARAQQQVAVAPQTGAAGSLAPAAPEPQAAPAASGFRWPVRGRVISGFGKKPNGERNDGINLAVPEGTAVKAAEDGTVIYAGNELKSYGNLVLVRHSNGWVSAYAHNSDLKVKRGDAVRRGQVIALSGMSGGVTTPQVHFELRKDASPVDPLQHLTET
jgi:murein DD-endopeptidase MepM/ murein hydrolase activator NlpD